MKRFSTWDLDYSADFWREKFKPSDILKITAHLNSMFSRYRDEKIIANYDILDVDSHTIGTIYTWVPITLPDPEYVDTDTMYPWCYEFDKKWLVIDAIYDKHIDPDICLQHDIDFIYESGSGKLYSAKEIKNADGIVPPLYISKGWYAEDRIYQEIGHLLDYPDIDSKTYRDSIMPILSAFYKCSSYFNLLAILNVMVGLPVAKYGDEKITTIKDGVITTDKYSYYIEDVHTSLQVGDTLYRFQPLTDAVELNTHEISPYWWKGRPVDTFARYYTKGIITEDIRDNIMTEYLFNSVAGVSFRQDRLGSHVIVINKDIYNLFFKATPSRSDFLFTQSYHVGTSYDLEENIIAPDEDERKIRIYIDSLYGRFDNDIGVNGQFAVSSKKIPRPTIDKSEEYTEGKSLKFDDGIWHIFSSLYDSFHEFWRYYDNLNTFKYNILFEPWADRVYMRNTEAIIPEDWKKSIIYNIPESLSTEYKETVFLNYGTPSAEHIRFKSSGNFSNLAATDVPKIQDQSTTYTIIEANTLYGTTEMENWILDNITIVSNGATVANDVSSLHKDTGYLIIPGISLGKIPKNICISTTHITPTTGALVGLEFSQNGTTWTAIEQKEKIKNITGVIYFRITLIEDTSVLKGKPILQEANIQITLN